MDESWSEGFVRILISPWVRGVLIVLFVISLLIEIAAPGFGLFGALAGVCLLILVGAPYLAGMAQWWEIILIVLGLALVATEIFVLPGFGVAGVTGVACLLVGVVGTFISGDVGTAQGQSELFTGLGATIVAIVAGIAGLWILSRYVHDIPFFRRFILSASVDDRSTAESAAGTELMSSTSASPAARLNLRVGDPGVATTDLRPAGRALFGGRMVDVITAGEYIESGAAVRISRMDGISVEVEAER